MDRALIKAPFTSRKGPTMSKNRKSRDADRGLFTGAGRVASRNRRALGIVGAGLAAVAALFYGRRYRDQRDAAHRPEDATVGTAAN